MQAEPVRHRERRLDRVVPDGGRGLGGRVVRLAELRRLHPQRAARLGGDLGEVRAAACPCRGCDRALDQRRRGQLDRAAVGIAHLDRQLRAHQRAAEVHQHEHAVGRPDRVDRGHHPRGVGADRAVVQAAGGGDRDVLAAHLARELGDAVGQPRAVRDDDEADHGSGEAGGAGEHLDRVDRCPRRWPARSASGRSPSRRRRGRTRRRRSAGRAGRPTSIAMPYFSFLSPYVPATPQQFARLSTTVEARDQRQQVERRLADPVPLLLARRVVGDRLLERREVGLELAALVQHEQVLADVEHAAGDDAQLLVVGPSRGSRAPRA